MSSKITGPVVLLQNRVVAGNVVQVYPGHHSYVCRCQQVIRIWNFDVVRRAVKTYALAEFSINLLRIAEELPGVPIV